MTQCIGVILPNDTVFLIVITCIPLDKTNDTDIGWNDPIGVIDTVILEGNDADITVKNDTDIGWNDTVFYPLLSHVSPSTKRMTLILGGMTLFS